MKLKDTVDLMLSANYTERFLAEYLQTKIRYDKLSVMVDKYKSGSLDFEPKCSLDLLKSQLDDMHRYLSTLEVRARIEGIELSGGCATND